MTQFMKFIKILFTSIIFWIFYIVLIWHGFVMGVLASEFICPLLWNWSGCEISQAWGFTWDLFFIIPSILFFWIYAGFIIHWNYKQLPMNEIQKVITMIFFALVSYPFLYLIGNAIYSEYIYETQNFIHTFLAGTFFSIIIWILCVIVYFFIQTNNKIKKDLQKNNIK